MSPLEVNRDNEDTVRARLYPLKPKHYKWKYNVGDRVRMAKQRRPLHKGYLGHWTKEVFEIAARLPTTPVTHELRDLSGESIKGRFYEPENQKVLKSDEERFDIDRIIRSRKRNGKIQYLVSWKGYPSNSILGSTNSSRDEQILHDTTIEQLDGLLSTKHRGSIYDETDRSD